MNVLNKKELSNSFRWRESIYFQNKDGFYKKKRFKMSEEINQNSYEISYKNYLVYRDKITDFNKKNVEIFKKSLKRLKNNSFTVLDLFCGCGGLSLGFANAGFNVLLAIDNDFPSCETYSYNFRKNGVLCLDLTEKEANPYYLKKFLGIDNFRFDLIIGGPPCQGFSLVGRPKIKSLIKKQIWDDPDIIEGDVKYNDNKHWFYSDPRNILYKKFLNYIAYFKPKAFLMENVPGMKSFQNGQVVGQIKLDFEDIGYSVQEKILNASDFLIPQNRKRLFFFGVNFKSKKVAKERNFFIAHYHKNQKTILPMKEFNDLFEFPTRNSKYLPVKDYEGIVTVRDAIGDLNEINNFGEEVDYIPSRRDSTYLQTLRKKALDAKVYNFLPRNTTKRDKKI